jgi:Lipoprotein amino terminal region
MAVSAEQLEGLFKSYERLGLDDAGTESSKQHEIDVAMVAGQTLESALITLRKPAAKDEAGKHEQSNAFRRLTALLRLDPKLVGDLMKWVKEGDPLSSTFIAALRDAGTKEAQTALTGLFRETSLSDNTRAELVRGLSLTANPTSESTELLRELSKGDSPFAEQAVFGLGSHARRAELAGNDNGAIMGELVGGLEGSKNAQTRARYLTALGNAGDHDSLPALRKSIEEGPATSRADAVHALRRIVGDDVDALLATQLTAPSPDVRRQAARAIRDREQTAILQAAVAKALRTESDGLVKNFLIEVAFLWAAKSPAIQASLNWLVEHEKNENLKHQAEIAIASLQQK